MEYGSLQGLVGFRVILFQLYVVMTVEGLTVAVKLRWLSFWKLIVYWLKRNYSGRTFIFQPSKLNLVLR